MCARVGACVLYFRKTQDGCRLASVPEGIRSAPCGLKPVSKSATSFANACPVSREKGRALYGPCMLASTAMRRGESSMSHYYDTPSNLTEGVTRSNSFLKER